MKYTYEDEYDDIHKYQLRPLDLPEIGMDEEDEDIGRFGLRPLELPNVGGQQTPSMLEDLKNSLLTRANAERMAYSTAGDYIGGALAPYTMGISYPVASFLGGAFGEYRGRKLEGKPFSPWAMGVEGVMNPLFPGPNIPGKGAALGEVAGYAGRAGLAGAQQGAAGSIPRYMAEQGIWDDQGKLNIPSAGRVAGETLTGLGVGTAVGGLLAGTKGGYDAINKSFADADLARHKPDIVTLQTNNPAEADMYRRQGYALSPNMRSPEGLPQMVRINAPDPSDTPPNIFQRAYENYAPEPVKRFIEDESGSLNIGEITTNLARMLGREPTEMEVEQAMNRQARPGDSTGNVAQFPRVNEPDPNYRAPMDVGDNPTDYYRLPDGRVVPTDGTATKGAMVIDFTLADGTIVQARKVPTPPARGPELGDPIPEVPKDRFGNPIMNGPPRTPEEVRDYYNRNEEILGKNNYDDMDEMPGPDDPMWTDSPNYVPPRTDADERFKRANGLYPEQWKRFQELSAAFQNHGFQDLPPDVQKAMRDEARALAQNFPRRMGSLNDLQNTVDSALPGPRERLGLHAAEGGVDIPVPLREGQGELPWARGEADQPIDADLDARIRSAAAERLTRPQGEVPEQLDLEGQMKDAEIQDYLAREDGTPPESTDLSQVRREGDVSDVLEGISWPPKVRTETDVNGNNRVWINDTEFTNRFGPGGPTDAEIQQLHRYIRDPESIRRLNELKAQQAKTEGYARLADSLERSNPEEAANIRKNYLQKFVEDETGAVPIRDTLDAWKKLGRNLSGVAEQLKHGTAQRWASIVEELDARRAPDIEYRDIMSTGSKTALRRGETWRNKVIDGLKYFEDLAERLARDESGSLSLPSKQQIKQATGWGMGQSTKTKRKKGVANVFQEALNVPTNATTMLDASAPGRQGLSQIFTKEFLYALGSMAKGISYSGFKDMDDKLRQHPLHRIPPGKKKSIAQEIGLKLYRPASELGPRAEGIASRWLEVGVSNGPLSQVWKHTIGYPIRASNRVHLTFLNQLNTNRTYTLMKRAQAMSMKAIQTGSAPMPGVMGGVTLPKWAGGLHLGLSQKYSLREAGGLDPFRNLALGKEIADFVNTATGHAPLKTHLIPHKDWEVNLSSSANTLNKFLFSPGLLASRVRMMNPSTYIMASPGVRKEYLKAALSTASAWYIFTELAKMAAGPHAEVSNDPTSADFGKVRLGKARLDLGGGFSQFAALYGRMIMGGTTTSKNNFRGFGEGYQAETQRGLIERFLVNKLNPVAKFGYDILDATEYKPVHMGDRTVQLFMPLFMQDIMQIYKEDPELLPWMAPAAFFGGGTQIYDESETEGKIISPKNDWIVEGGGARDLMPWNWGARRKRTFPWSKPTYN